MTDFSYKTVKDKVEESYKNKLNIELCINNDLEKEKIISNLLKRDSLDDKYGLFKMIELNDITILEYETIDTSKNRKKDNILVINKECGMFKLEHYDNSKYCEDTFSIYDVNNRLLNRIYIEEIFNVIKIKLLDKNDTTNDYYKKDYTLYNEDNKVISLRLNDQMYFDFENGFNGRINTAIGLVNSVFNKINNKFDEILGIEKIKEYKILRKKQEH